MVLEGTEAVQSFPPHTSIEIFLPSPGFSPSTVPNHPLDSLQQNLTLPPQLPLPIRPTRPRLSHRPAKPFPFLNLLSPLPVRLLSRRSSLLHLRFPALRMLTLLLERRGLWSALASLWSRFGLLVCLWRCLFLFYECLSCWMRCIGRLVGLVFFDSHGCRLRQFLAVILQVAVSFQLCVALLYLRAFD